MSDEEAVTLFCGLEVVAFAIAQPVEECMRKSPYHASLRDKLLFGRGLHFIRDRIVREDVATVRPVNCGVVPIGQDLLDKLGFEIRRVIPSVHGVASSGSCRSKCEPEKKSPMRISVNAGTHTTIDERAHDQHLSLISSKPASGFPG